MGAPERVSRSPLNKASELKFRVHACMLGYACGYKLANDGQDTRALQHYLGTGTDGTRSPYAGGERPVQRHLAGLTGRWRRIVAKMCVVARPTMLGC